MYTLATTTPRLLPYPPPANLLRKERLTIGQQQLCTQLILPNLLGFRATPNPSSERIEEVSPQNHDQNIICPFVLNLHPYSHMKKYHHSTRALRWYPNSTHLMIVHLQKETCSPPNRPFKMNEEWGLGGDLPLPQSVKRAFSSFVSIINHGGLLTNYTYLRG